MTNPVIILGASENAERYSYKATQMLLEYDYSVYLIGHKSGMIFNHTIHSLEESQHAALQPQIITLYVGPKNQSIYIDHILTWKPRYVIFNPGTENKAFEDLLTKHHIEPILACTLVMLKTGEFKALNSI